ncbi:hypothetical protein [Streptomyces sp. NPDC002889]|uniref:hypothetical protein n=1 Tax=Streptomyces sp. NPDC002889 TaxID=3364669 RepID=UPI0036AB995A
MLTAPAGDPGGILEILPAVSVVADGEGEIEYRGMNPQSLTAPGIAASSHDPPGSLPPGRGGLR